MQFIDIIIIGVLIYGVFKGIWNGFFVALASLISIVLGIYLAIKFSSIFSGLITSITHWSEKSVQIVSFAITFIIVIIGINLLAKIFTKMASFASLGWINKIAGGFFGLLRTLVVLSVALNLFSKINRNNILISEETLQESVTYQPIMTFSQKIYPTLQDWISENNLIK